MNEHTKDRQKAFAPLAPTPLPGGASGTRTTRLPDDLLDEQIQRLALFAAVAAGLWTFGLVIDRVLLRVVPGSVEPPPIVAVVEIAAIVVATAMFAYVKYGAHSGRRKADVGLGFMLVNTFAIGLINAWTDLPARFPPFGVSWNAVAILIFAMFVPASPRKMLGAALISATMDPFALWLSYLAGGQVPTVAQAFILFIPNYACAAVATVPSHFLQRLGRRLREAQDLGSYQLVELLGRGGMGEVWLAHHRLLARSAAVKLVRPEVLGAGGVDDTRTVLRRFEREAQATSALSSPHTIQVFDYGMTEQGTFYYVMELLAGRDMESLVREFGPLPADRVVYLLRQACHSLADAHARGLVHRDVKPANIYVCRMGLDYDFVKVLDFGLVKLRRQGSDRLTLHTMDQTTGTPAYMAPEIILGESDVDRRADVYALGCVAYYLLTGQLVFEADTSMKMLLRHVQDAPVPPSQRTELPVPRDLDELILACLEKDPAKRPQDAQQLFQLACGCGMGASWSPQHARSWWETHLPDLSGPLTIDVEDLSPKGVPVG